MNNMKDIIKEKLESDKEHNYNAILSKINKMEGGKNMKKRYVLIPAFSLILVLVIAIGLNSDIFKNIGGNQVSTGDGTTKAGLKINKLDEMAMGSMDVDIKAVEIEELPEKFDFIQNLKLPDRFKFDLGQMIYTRDSLEKEEYNILHDYLLIYNVNENVPDSIKIAFSEEYEPVRDYFIEHENSKTSKINNTDVTIYQYEKMYIAYFEYNGIKFDVETTGISEEELVTLLGSIIES